MEKFDLKSALSYYQIALDAVRKAKKKSSSSEILEVLIARDRLQTALQDTAIPDKEILLTILELDKQWKQQSAWVTKKVDLEEWRNSFDPPESSWWWYLEQPVHQFDRLDWLWRGLYIGCLMVACSLVFNISSRFLSGGADTLGAFTISVQTLLTFLTAKGTLTTVGKQGVRRVLTRLHIPRYWLQEVELGLSILLLLALYGLFSILPEIAAHYRSKGLRYYEAGYLATAEANYQRALSIAPEEVSTNFYLGVLYEDMQNYPLAKQQYRIATEAGYLPAYSNLARLYILDKKYTDAAVLLQRQKVQGIPLEDNVLNYAYHKNLGWIQLQQNRLRLAEINLEEAIKLNDNQAPAHCLLAQVLEKDNKSPEEVRTHWESCLGFATALTPEEADWMTMAQDYLIKNPPQ